MEACKEKILGAVAAAGCLAVGYALGRRSGARQTATSSDDVPSVLALKDGGQRAGADTGPDTAMTMVKGFEKSGLWSCSPGGFPVKNRPTTETVLILSGAATITNDADGSKVYLRAGSWHVLPTGWSGRWDVTEQLMKLYVITP